MLDRRGEAGSTHVLEAVIIATIMISAVAFVSTFESPSTTNSGPARTILKQRADDALSILYDTPVRNSNFGDNKLSVLLAQCMQGNCTNMSTELQRLLPQGASFAVYVSNGYKTYPVLVTREPQGEAVTASQSLQPSWSSSFVTTGATNVNPTTDSLLVYTMPIFNSNVLSQGGSPLRVLVEAERLADHSNYSLTGFFSTQQSDVTVATPAVSLTFQNLTTGKPSGYEDAYWHYRWDQDAPGVGSFLKVAVLKLNVSESANVPIPIGTEVTINVPRSWNATADPADNPLWTIVQNATDTSGAYGTSDVVARLKSPLQMSTATLTLHATYNNDSLDNYPFHATLAKGALAEANLLVRADAHPGTISAEVPSVELSMPRPMGSNHTTNWTLSVDLPVKADNKYLVVKGGAAGTAAGIDSRITINTISIIEQDGKSIFGAVTPIASNSLDDHGWRVGGDRITWVGNHTVGTSSGNNTPLSLSFAVTGTGTNSAPGAKNSFVPPVNFTGFTGRALQQVAPGFYRDDFLQSNGTYGGYDGSVDLATGFGHSTNFSSNATYRAAYLPGTSNYTPNPTSSVQDSVYGSYVAVDKRSVPIGNAVVVTADVQSMLFALSEAGISAGVKVSFYPPWAGNDRTPIYQSSALDQGVLRSDATQILMLDVNGDGFPDPIVGTTNGRVFAYNGLTGGRIEGKSFTVPTSASVQVLTNFTYDGQSYIVVGADHNGGIYVLDSAFNIKWSDTTGPKSGLDTLMIDATTDVTGDGKNDIVAAFTSASPGASPTTNFVVYRVPTSQPLDVLSPLAPATPVVGAPAGTLFRTFGRSAAAFSLAKLAFNGTTPGVAAAFSNSATVSGIPTPNPNNPAATADTSGYIWVWNQSGYQDGSQLTNDQLAHLYDVYANSAINNTGMSVMTPRAGIQGYDKNGALAWTIYGSPITAGARADYDGDGVPDFVIGSSAGYVSMINGKAPASPLHTSGSATGLPRIDTWMHDAGVGASLFSDTTVALTQNGWTTLDWADDWTHNNSIRALPHAGALALAMNETLGVWIVGQGAAAYRSLPADTGQFTPQVLTATVPLNVTRYWAGDAGHVLEIGANPLTQVAPDLHSVAFKWGADRDKGWIVGSPLNNTTLGPRYGGESFVAKTTDGGQTWHELNVFEGTLLAADGTHGVNGTVLTRINFTDKDHAWITGTGGVLLRSTDGGAHFQQVALAGITQNLRDVSCAPNNPDLCLLVGENGLLMRSTNATAAYPGWTTIAFPLSSNSAFSVAMGPDGTAAMGATNAVLRSYDAGLTWAPLPMSYVPGNGYRSFIGADGRGFVFGGNATDRVFHLQDYGTWATVTTASKGSSNPIPASNYASEAHITVETQTPDKSDYPVVGVDGSVDGGHTWVPFSVDGPAGFHVGSRDGTTYTTYSNVTHSFSGYFPDRAGRDLQVRVNLATPALFMQSTATVLRIYGFALYNDTGSLVRNPAPANFDWDMTRLATFDSANTTAEYDPVAAAFHTVSSRPYWNQNVSGFVNDIVTGMDAGGADSRAEVWVGTGMTLAANSPDYALYAQRDPNAMMQLDGRIYKLDGKTGAILNKTAPFEGNVTHLRLADNNSDGKPDFLYATIDAGVAGSATSPATSYLACLNATTLQVLWETKFPNVASTDLEPGTTTGAFSDGLMSTRSANGGASSSGFVTALNASDASVVWQSLPDQLGLYTLTVPIPDNWFFGPYVVETSVNWTETVQGTGQATQTVVQTARLYDYFMVTPPSLVNPPSPIYDVKLVSWFDDWR